MARGPEELARLDRISFLRRMSWWRRRKDLQRDWVRKARTFKPICRPFNIETTGPMSVWMKSFDKLEKSNPPTRQPGMRFLYNWVKHMDEAFTRAKVVGENQAFCAAEYMGNGAKEWWEERAPKRGGSGKSGYVTWEEFIWGLHIYVKANE